MQTQRLKQTFVELVAIDSPSLKEGAVATYVRSRLEALGVACADDSSAGRTGSDTGNLIARIPGKAGGSSLLLAAHMDTVAPCLGKRAVEKNGRFVSGGDTILGADDFAGIAIMLEMARRLVEEKPAAPDVTLLFTTGEEIGLVGAKQLQAGSLKADFGYVLDDAGPAGGAICHAPAHAKITVNIRGRSAHAGVEPEKGVDAIRIFAKAVDSMPLGRLDAETTANIGLVKGGTAMNAVCAELEAVGEARSRSMDKLNEQIVHMRRCFENAAEQFGGSVRFEHNILYQALNWDGDQPVALRFKRSAEALGLPFACKISGGGSDASVINGLGIPTITLAVGYEQMHTTDEYLDIAEFEKAAALVWDIVTRE